MLFGYILAPGHDLLANHAGVETTYK